MICQCTRLKVDAVSADIDDLSINADDYSQAGALFRLMNQQQKEQLTGNIDGSQSQVSEEVQNRMLLRFQECD